MADPRLLSADPIDAVHWYRAALEVTRAGSLSIHELGCRGTMRLFVPPIASAATGGR